MCENGKRNNREISRRCKKEGGKEDAEVRRTRDGGDYDRRGAIHDHPHAMHGGVAVEVQPRADKPVKNL